MSIRAHRVNKLEYDNKSNNAVAYALGYGKELRSYLKHKDILQTSEGWDYQFEIDVPGLTTFIKNYTKLCKSDKELTASIQKEIKDDNLLEEFQKEIDWAIDEKIEYILYHEF